MQYARWMARHEVPYQEVMYKVDIPTETWPAHDIRKCHVFHLAAQYSLGSERGAFGDKAGFFYRRCLEDLLAFKTAFYARPLILITLYNYVHIYFERTGYLAEEEVMHSYDFKEPAVFLPQKARLKKTFSEKIFLFGRLLKLFVKGHLLSMKRNIGS